MYLQVTLICNDNNVSNYAIVVFFYVCVARQSAKYIFPFVYNLPLSVAKKWLHFWWRFSGVTEEIRQTNTGILYMAHVGSFTDGERASHFPGIVRSSSLDFPWQTCNRFYAAYLLWRYDIELSVSVVMQLASRTDAWNFVVAQSMFCK